MAIVNVGNVTIVTNTGPHPDYPAKNGIGATVWPKGEEGSDGIPLFAVGCFYQTTAEALVNAAWLAAEYNALQEEGIPALPYLRKIGQDGNKLFGVAAGSFRDAMFTMERVGYNFGPRRIQFIREPELLQGLARGYHVVFTPEAFMHPSSVDILRECRVRGCITLQLTDNNGIYTIKEFK